MAKLSRLWLTAGVAAMLTFGLGCGGIVEMLSGGTVAFSEGRVRFPLPDGGYMQMLSGDEATHPPDFLLPPPPQGKMQMLMEIAIPPGEPTRMLVYETTAPDEEMLVFYRDQLQSMGLAFDEQHASEVEGAATSDGTVLRATQGEQIVLVQVGGGGLMLMVGDPQAMKQAQNNFGDQISVPETPQTPAN